MKLYKGKTKWAKIYIAGPIEVIEQACREYVSQGLCVNVKQTNYIYKYGSETGAEIELINYPKYPIKRKALMEHAEQLAKHILDYVAGGSFSIVGQYSTYTFDRRDDE